jgi:hypothetical protein
MTAWSSTWPSAATARRVSDRPRIATAVKWYWATPATRRGVPAGQLAPTGSCPRRR